MINIANIRMKPKLILIFLLIGVFPIICSAVFSAYLSTKSLIDASTAKIVSIQNMKKSELEGQFKSYVRDVETAAKTAAIVEVLETENLASADDPHRLSALLKKDNHFFDSYLQEETERLRTFAKTYQYSELYIVDSKIGNIIYTINDVKSRGVNILTGDFKGTTFSKTWERAVKQNDAIMSDFDVMSATDNRQMAFIACPILNGYGEKEAILIVSYDVKLVTDVVESREGLGKTGESYMIGWQEEEEIFEFRSSVSSKYGDNITIGTTITALPYWWDALAKDSEGGSGLYTDSIGNGTLVVYNQIDLPGLNWFLISKIDKSEIVQPLIYTFYKLIFFAVVCSIIIIFVAIKVAKSLTNPMLEEMNYAKAIAHGNFDEELDVERKDEIGDLGRSLKDMSEKLFTVDWIRTKQEDLDNLLRGNQEIQTISQDCINFFVQNLGASLGAIYLNNSNLFELEASHSFSDRNKRFANFSLGEGLVGQAAEDNEVLFYSKTEGPSYNYGMGEEKMRFFVAAPLSKDGNVIAVMLLGSFREFSELEKKFIKQNVDNIAILFAVASSRDSIANLLETSQQQQVDLEKSNEKLEEQKLDLQSSEAELQAQQEELRVTNEELMEQTKSLLASEEELQAQQEELRVTNEGLTAQTLALQVSEQKLQDQQEELQLTNEKLESKSTNLEKQQKTITRKNNELEEARVEVERRMVEVEKASKHKSEFLSNMSHELRTPLNSILILSQLLGENKFGNLTEKQTTSANAINASGEDLLKLINEILDLSKIEAGKIDLNIETLTFKQVEDDLNRLYGEIAKQKGLSFLINKGGKLPAKFASDNQRLQQILRNLVSNAIKFTSEGEVSVGINLATSAQLYKTDLEGKEALCFAVKDDGIGIPKDKHDSVFMAFQQADGTTSVNFGGTGLGLSISKELAKLLGGFLVLESAENVGSTFSVFIPVNYNDGNQEFLAGAVNLQVEKIEEVAIPVAQVNVSKTPVVECQLPERPAKSIKPLPSVPAPLLPVAEDVPDDRKTVKPDSKSLLIIEDDKNFAKVLIDFGRERGFDCIYAGDGETGLHFADYYLPSAIILDIGLPGISGWEVMERLKENSELRHIPVHFMSAEDSSMDAMRMGAVGFLTKPISAGKIEETLSKLEHLSSHPVRKLLLVEDDKLQQDSIKELIGDNNVETTGVRTGAEAYSFLIASHFDCIILDLGLEDMSGFELLEKIRTDESLQKIPIIIYTGRDLSQDEEDKLTKYADSIIIKGAKTPERLLDETALFLHRVESDLPEEKRNMLKQIHNRESILSGTTLLIVDDDMRNIFALSSILEDRGIDVIIARDGVEALQKLKENIDIIDGVLMDIMMPNMDGYEAMTRIRQDMKLTKLPIISLTAKNMKDDRMKCIDAGANDYLAKPINTEKLISILKVWLY